MKFKAGDKVKIKSFWQPDYEEFFKVKIGDIGFVGKVEEWFSDNDQTYFVYLDCMRGRGDGGLRFSYKDLELVCDCEENTQEYDVVNKPKHYNSDPSGVQCIELTRCLSSDAANALKYIWRDGKKDEILQERKKAQWYVNDLIEYDVPIAIEGLGDTIEFEDKVKKVLSTWSGWKYIFLNALYWNDKQEMKRAIDALVKEAETNS